MAKKQRMTAEQKVNKLREAEVLLSQACSRPGNTPKPITPATSIGLSGGSSPVCSFTQS